MLTISQYLIAVKILFLALLSISFLIKLVLFFKMERNWDALRFFHYSRVDLKMTNRRDLRVWRKRQNTLTMVVVVLFLLFCASALLNMLIE